MEDCETDIVQPFVCQGRRDMTQGLSSVVFLLGGQGRVVTWLKTCHPLLCFLRELGGDAGDARWSVSLTFYNDLTSCAGGGGFVYHNRRKGRGDFFSRR